LTKQSITEKRSDGSFQVRFARRIPHPIERVWEALTDPAELRKWWGDADLHPDPGAPTTLTWGLDPDGDHTLHHFTTPVSGPDDDTTAAGWHLHLDARATLLSGGQVDIAHPDPIFEPIHRAYTERYGTTDD
jgi:hypothetical protein